MNPSVPQTLSITSFEEVGCGLVLVAVTMAIHCFGMIATLRTSNVVRERTTRFESFFMDASVLIIASSMILIIHLLEVVVWAVFFLWRGGMPNGNTSFYFALMNYTTVGSSFSLPIRLRLLGGVLAVAGLLTFAWSTGTLLTLAQDFQERHLKAHQRRPQKAASSESSAIAS